MRFCWDEKKALSNVGKHGLSFEEAITAFDDPWSLIAPDGKHSTASETRQWLIGHMDDGRIVVVVFTEREHEVCRIISARPASRRERRIYETLKNFPL